MDTIEKKFHSAFLKYGGIYNRGPGKAYFDDIVKLMQSSVNRTRALNQKLPEVYVDVISNPQLNAAAAKSNGEYFIGIHAATYFLILNLFLRMLSTSKVLSNFGDAKKENGPFKIYNPQITDIQFLISDSTEYIPKDRTRKKLASFLTSLAIEFLILHEYAHIIFGHVDFVNSLQGVNEAFSEDRSNILTEDVSQTLEMDADCFAISQMVKWATNFVTRKEFLNADVREFHFDNDMIIELILFSTYSFFRLFGETVLKKTHPPSGIRQSLIFSTVNTLIQQSGKKILRTSFTDISMNVMNSVEDAFDLISEKELNREAIRYAYSKEGIEHSSFLIDNWKKVRPLLEPFAIGNLAPA